MMTSLFLRHCRPLWLAASLVASAGAARSATLLVNGAFDSGGTGWSLFGGAAVIATGELSDNPYGRVPDGSLALLYQKAVVATPLIRVTFDYFTGLMSPQFPSPGAFPDTAFASVHFGETEAGLRPEVFQAASSLNLFDYDAANGLHSLLLGATVVSSPVRPGWSRFEALLSAVPGQPHFSLTFQTLNGNGTPGDSAFLVDNLEVLPIPEPSAALLLAGSLLTLLRRRSAHFL